MLSIIKQQLADRITRLGMSCGGNFEEVLECGEGQEDDFQEVGAQLLRAIGVPETASVAKTPARFAASMRFLTRGYRTSVAELLNGALFDDDHDEMVTVRNIDFYSLCEHHLLPFFGKIHVAYIPNKKVVGLSKIPRLAELFTRRLQIQERLTRQIATCLEEALQPLGVAVVIKATYYPYASYRWVDTCAWRCGAWRRATARRSPHAC